jgi:hypothetical protein
MATTLEWTTNEKWQSIVARCAAENPPEHRRKDERVVPGPQRAYLAFEDEGIALKRSGTVLNISPTGLMIKLFHKLTCGTRVVLRATIDEEDVLLHGRVIHCTATVGGFKLGIELEFAESAPDCD